MRKCLIEQHHNNKVQVYGHCASTVVVYQRRAVSVGAVVEA